MKLVTEKPFRDNDKLYDYDNEGTITAYVLHIYETISFEL